ncbi:hypothetical protein BH09VER1_BH09VER1_10860 [soil metagenome]
MRLFCFFFAISAGSLLAQESAPNRLVFPPGATEPAPAQSHSLAGIKGQTPEEVMNSFFASLKANQIDSAYDALVKNTVIADRADDVKSLKIKTKQALDSYGPVSGFEVVDEKVVGTCLLRRTCISLNSDLPLRWRFYFYKSDAWRLVDIRIDDGLVELFDEAGRARK